MNRIVAFTDSVAGGPAHEKEGSGIDLYPLFRRCEVEQFGGSASLAAKSKCHSAAAQILRQSSAARPCVIEREHRRPRGGAGGVIELEPGDEIGRASCRERV